MAQQKYDLQISWRARADVQILIIKIDPTTRTYTHCQLRMIGPGHVAYTLADVLLQDAMSRTFGTGPFYREQVAIRPPVQESPRTHCP